MKLQKKRNENNTCQIVSVNITVSFVSHVEDMIQVWGFNVCWCFIAMIETLVKRDLCHSCSIPQTIVNK